MLKISPHFEVIHVDFKHEVMKLSFARLDLQMSVPPDVRFSAELQFSISCRICYL